MTIEERGDAMKTGQRREGATCVVGIGASAGGLEAIREMLSMIDLEAETTEAELMKMYWPVLPRNSARIGLSER